jgi:hypothetical protein
LSGKGALSFACFGPFEKIPMNCRPYFLCCVLLALGACAHRQPVAERVTPPEVFKVHPGLLGAPVPPELQPVREEAAPPPADVDANGADAAS